MNQRFAAFLMVAEAENIAKAAEKLYVSYQCVSAHIRSLEDEYGVRLVERKPHFHLTGEGRILLDTLQKMRILEDGIAQSFAGGGNGVYGRVTLGVPSSRYTEIVPKIVPAYKKEFNNVELEVIYDYSSILQNQVERGLLDLAIVVQQQDVPSPKLDSLILLQDTFLFILSDELLQKCLGDRADSLDQQFCRQGISLAEIALFPVIKYPPNSRFQIAMDRYAAENGIAYQTVFSTNRTEILDTLARTGIAGCIIPHLIYESTARNNRYQRKSKRLHAYVVNMENKGSSISLIRHRDSVLPGYKQRLVSLICEQFDSYKKNANPL